MLNTTYPSLYHKHIFITGGASGIGAALVEAFLAQNCRVFFVDVDDRAAHTLIQRLQGEGIEGELKLIYDHCDLREVSSINTSVERAVQRFGAIHTLINNAAYDERHRLGEVTAEYWDQCQNINLRPHFFTAQAALKSMTQGGGSIINMSSNSFMLKVEGMPGYLTAKAGIIGLTRALAREVGADRVRVNAILPGWVMTERQRDLWLTPEAESKLLETQCLKQTIQPEDVAKLALFLSSDDSAMITAQSLIIDGGRA